MDEIHVQYKGFSPSWETQAHVRELLQQLHDEAPTSSVVRAHISRVSDSFKGIMRITSAAGDFFAIASGRRIGEVTTKLSSRIRRQLMRWKSLRFTNETIRRHYDAAN